MGNRVFGFNPSVIDGSERIFHSSIDVELPEKYTFKGYMPPVMDQGEESICVPCTISAYLNWRENLKDGKIRDNKIALYEIYDSRTNDGEGMSYKEAFKILKKDGVDSKNGLLKISSYGMVLNFLSLIAVIATTFCFKDLIIS